MANTANYIGLETAILEDGIRFKNFFNGRLLSAEDLRQDQEENRKSHWRLGEAIGDGVAYGFEVSINGNSTKDAPVVDVEGGLAVSRSGKVLKATNKQSIALTAQGTAIVDGFASFTPCQPSLGGTYKARPGLYVLTVTSAFGNSGRAQVSGLGNTSVSCNTDNVIEGLQFRLLEVSSEISAPPGDANFRNRVAYEFFYKVNSPQESITNPFRPPAVGYGVLDALRDKDLSDCDVPLAFIFWSAAKGIEFVDMWSVRRRLVAKAVYGAWELSAGDRRRSEAEAAWLQFQMHLGSITREPGVDLINLKADSRFRFLPPAGYLPSVFDWKTFLGPMAPLKSKPIDGGLLTSILQRSLLMEPVRVVSFADGIRAKIDPPVPLDVYQVPSESFVMFARSRRGRIRVFFNPPPFSLQSFVVEATNSSNTLATNGELAAAGDHFIIDAPPGEGMIELTPTGFVTPGPVPVEAIGGRTVDLVFELTPLPKGSIVVTVLNTTPPDLARSVQLVSATNSRNRSFAGSLDSTGKWVIPDLPVDSYAVRVVAPGFEAFIRPTVAVISGQATAIDVELTPVDITKIGDPPVLQIDTTLRFVSQDPLDVNVAMLFKETSDVVLDPAIQKDAVEVKLDEKGHDWLTEWQTYLEKLYKGNDIRRYEPQVFLSSALVATLLGKSELRGKSLAELEQLSAKELAALSKRTLFKKAQPPGALTVFGNGALALNMRIIRVPEK